jgi:amino-acid racemase
MYLKGLEKMKTIGMLGGMSWESTQVYYKLVNEEIRKRLGKLHSAKIILYSLDFEEIEMLQHKGDWDATE